MILFVRDLTVIDFSYLCPERGMLGESLIVDVELHGELDEASMVFDFGLVKKVIKQVIDQSLDHALALPSQFAGCQLTRADDHLAVHFSSERGLIQVAGPACAFALLPAEQINYESIDAFLQQQLTGHLPDNVTAIHFTLRPEQSQGFYYHYSHGLKKHDGNCQRIAHGHRSTIQIYQNGMLSPRLNKFWAERWQDIYLVTEEDLCQPEQLQWLTPVANSLHSQYDAGQGHFEISLPVEHCEIVPCDTTVECLADYIAAQLKLLDPAQQFKVVAYEGVGKGAIASA
ncbi:MAG: 6-carboxytetrahydropterin synthase [Alkalimonas sp.]|nr:6-carboxytetrahydropterin synthase [Alkalimonas sp.]